MIVESTNTEDKNRVTKDPDSSTCTAELLRLNELVKAIPNAKKPKKRKTNIDRLMEAVEKLGKYWRSKELPKKIGNTRSHVVIHQAYSKGLLKKEYISGKCYWVKTSEVDFL